MADISDLMAAQIRLVRELDEALRGPGRPDPSLPEVAWRRHLDRVRHLVEVEQAAVWMCEVAHSGPDESEYAEALDGLTHALNRQGAA